MSVAKYFTSIFSLNLVTLCCMKAMYENSMKRRWYEEWEGNGNEIGKVQLKG